MQFESCCLIDINLLELAPEGRLHIPAAMDCECNVNINYGWLKIVDLKYIKFTPCSHMYRPLVSYKNARPLINDT